MPPIIEEEHEIPVMLEQSQRQEQRLGSNESGVLKIEELPNVPENEERPIVLFKPIITTPLLHSSSNFSVSVDPHLISGLKSKSKHSWLLILVGFLCGLEFPFAFA